MKGGKYANTLAKTQVSTILHKRDFHGNDLTKFIEFSMETPCCCPSETDMVAGNQKKLLSLSLATKA